MHRMVQAEKKEETSKHGGLGRFSTCSTERIQVLPNTIERHHPKTIKMETGEIMCEKEDASPPPPPKISFKDNWMKEMDSEAARGNQDQTTNYQARESCEE